jgi:hypothetical protein
VAVGVKLAAPTSRGFYASMVAAQAGLIAVAGRLTETYVSIDCPIRSLTGLQCPGCGSTRCLSAIGGGDIVGGFRYNPLVTSLLAISVGVGVVGVASPGLVKSLIEAYQRRRASVALLSVLAISLFTVGRNLTL